MKKTIAMLLACLLLCATFISCRRPEDAVRVYTLTGTTGFGMAKLMDDAANKNAQLSYQFTKETDPTLVRDAILSGDADIAALPTNVAAALYNATNGGVKVLALNTKGVLHLITKAELAVTALSELSGKTLYCPAQNPAFITAALLEKAGTTDVILDSTTYAKAEELREAVANGYVDYAILPEPMVTIAVNVARQNDLQLSVSLDLTAEWNKYFPANSLVQGCVVARSEFIEQHPEEITTFLAEYAASIAYVTEDHVKGGDVIARTGILSAAAVAQNALPRCNLCYISGTEMQAALSAFLAEMPLASIGGALPNEDFYYLP